MQRGTSVMLMDWQMCQRYRSHASILDRFEGMIGIGISKRVYAHRNFAKDQLTGFMLHWACTCMGTCLDRSLHSTLKRQ